MQRRIVRIATAAIDVASSGVSVPVPSRASLSAALLASPPRAPEAPSLNAALLSVAAAASLGARGGVGGSAGGSETSRGGACGGCGDSTNRCSGAIGGRTSLGAGGGNGERKSLGTPSGSGGRASRGAGGSAGGSVRFCEGYAAIGGIGGEASPIAQRRCRTRAAQARKSRSRFRLGRFLMRLMRRYKGVTIQEKGRTSCVPGAQQSNQTPALSPFVEVCSYEEERRGSDRGPLPRPLSPCPLSPHA